VRQTHSSARRVQTVACCYDENRMTTKTADYRIVVATDGSTQARAALATVLAVPWPAETHVRAVIARQRRPPYSRSILLSALDRRWDEAAARAGRTLARRWPDADAVVVEKPDAVAGILHEAARFRADLVAVGWRGHGATRRLLMGSVSRGVVRGAKCAVLVVRQRSAPVRRIVIGFDGSPNAQRGVQLVAKLLPPPNGRVMLVGVSEIPALSSFGPAVGGIRSTIAREVRRLNTEATSVAMKALNRAAAELERSGWRTRTQLRTGEPLRELLAVVGTADPQLVVVGARGTSGVSQLLLGSVAEGVLNRSPVPVLLAR
jgi:nucleotide-binding universal stress UspA family protein